VPFDWRRIGFAVAFTVGLCVASLALDLWAPFRLSLPLRAAILAAYPLTLLAVGFFPREDLAKVRARLFRR
jgi:hypothetical protein